MRAWRGRRRGAWMLAGPHGMNEQSCRSRMRCSDLCTCRYSRDAAEMQPRCGEDAAKMRQRCGEDAAG